MSVILSIFNAFKFQYFYSQGVFTFGAKNVSHQYMQTVHILESSLKFINFDIVN